MKPTDAPDCPYCDNVQMSTEFISPPDPVGQRWAFCNTCSRRFVVDGEGRVVRIAEMRVPERE